MSCISDKFAEISTPCRLYRTFFSKGDLYQLYEAGSQDLFNSEARRLLDLGRFQIGNQSPYPLRDLGFIDAFLRRKNPNPTRASRPDRAPVGSLHSSVPWSHKLQEIFLRAAGPGCLGRAVFGTAGETAQLLEDRFRDRPGNAANRVQPRWAYPSFSSTAHLVRAEAKQMSKVRRSQM
jgi:hypothetical protein